MWPGMRLAKRDRPPPLALCIWAGGLFLSLSPSQDSQLQGRRPTALPAGPGSACQCASVCEGGRAAPRAPLTPPPASGHRGWRRRPRKWLTTHTSEGAQEGLAHQR